VQCGNNSKAVVTWPGHKSANGIANSLGKTCQKLGLKKGLDLALARSRSEIQRHGVVSVSDHKVSFTSLTSVK